MPGIDGLEVLRRIRQTKIYTEVIIITGHGDMEKAVKALDLDVSDFINKPVGKKALNSALNRAEKRLQVSDSDRFKAEKTIENTSFVVHIKGKLTGVTGKVLFKMLSWDIIQSRAIMQDLYLMKIFPLIGRIFPCSLILFKN